MQNLINKLYELELIEDRKTHHPESDVLNHSYQCFDYALKETHDIELHVAALFHDIGKVERDEFKKHIFDHADRAIEVMIELGYKNDRVFKLISNHMRIHYYLDGSIKKLGKIEKLTNDVDFISMVKLSRWDKMGREKKYSIKYKYDYVLDILNKTNEI